jgi:N-methylhydantoinase B
MVSVDAALEYYGVVIAGQVVDLNATETRRHHRTPVKAFHRQEYVDVLA